MTSLVDLQATVMSWMLSAQAQVGNVVPHRNSMMAESPWTNYTAAVVGYVIVIGFLVALLLIGGILVVNLGMMSKRTEDRRGGRAPSEVGILGDTIWPQDAEPPVVLPAEDEGQGGEKIASHFSSRQPVSHNVQTRIDIDQERRKREEWRQKSEEAAAENSEATWEREEMERRGRTERPPHEPGKAA